MKSSRQSYFKEFVESIGGEPGIGYYEYSDNFGTRQINVFNTRIERFSQERGHPNLNMTDQPLTNRSICRDNEISQNEFENTWGEDRIG